MVVGLIVALVVAVAITAYVLSQMDFDDQDAADMSDITTTQCQEGAVVPIIFGRVKTAANLIWYGNLYTKEIVEEGLSFGKWDITEDVVTGYEYYLDLWQSICMGPAEIITCFVSDDPISKASLIANCKHGAIESDGNDTDTPQTRMGGAATYPYVTKLPGVVWIYLDRYELGENVTTVPTIHFVVQRTSTSPLTNADISGQGMNPAAFIYEVLELGGAVYADFNIASFQSAANYWNSKGYGLNLAIKKQMTVRDIIKKVFTFVDGCLTVDENDQWYLTAYRDSGESSSATLEKTDFVKFQFSRKDWGDTYNYFKGAYVDQDKNYTKRNVVAMNPAVLRLLGYKKTMSVDLSAFRTKEAASQRLWEIMKTQSYPAAQIQFTTSLEFSTLREGQIITINNDEYDIADAEFRIIEKDLANVENNEVDYVAIQYVHGLFDDNYQVGGAPQGENIDTTPAQVASARVFEMPFMGTGHNPTWLFLAARQGNETSAQIWVSVDGGTEYIFQSSISTFAQRGELDGAYGITPEIDDSDEGILYTPDRDDPTFESISRSQLFRYNRFLIIDDELMTFQNVTPVGGSQYRLTGIVRGLGNTTITSHSSGTKIWLTNAGSNLITSITANSFHAKILPSFGGETVDASGASAYAATVTNKAQTPYSPTRFEAVRTGSTVVFTWWPTTQDNVGAGFLPGDVQADQSPFLYDGDFFFDASVGAHDQYVDGITLTISQSGAFTAYLQARRAGYLSSQISLSVGAGDGTYTGPIV